MTDNNTAAPKGGDEGTEQPASSTISGELATEAVRRSGRFRLKKASEYEDKVTRWLWAHRIPFGHISAIEGDPDLGKSIVASDICARITTGTAFPGGRPFSPKSAIILSAEDVIQETIKPRLRAAGADLDRINFIEVERDDFGVLRPFTIPDDVEYLEQLIRDDGVGLVIVDPMAAYYGEEIRTHNDASLRRALAPLKEAADRTGAAIVLIRHLNKSGDTKALYRGGGSIAFTGAARGVMLAAKYPHDDNLRVLARVKGNLAAPYQSWIYQIEIVQLPGYPDGVPRIKWLREEDWSADRLLAASADEHRRRAPAQNDAQDWLREFLEQSDGMALVKVLKEEAENAGLKWRTVERVADRMRIAKHRLRSEGRLIGWIWDMPLPGDLDDNGLLLPTAVARRDKRWSELVKEAASPRNTASER